MASQEAIKMENKKNTCVGAPADTTPRGAGKGGQTKRYYVRFEHGDFGVDVRYTRTEYAPLDIDEEWAFQHPLTGQWEDEIYRVLDGWSFQDPETEKKFEQFLSRVSVTLGDDALCEDVVGRILDGEEVIDLSQYFSVQ